MSSIPQPHSGGRDKTLCSESWAALTDEGLSGVREADSPKRRS